MTAQPPEPDNRPDAVPPPPYGGQQPPPPPYGGQQPPPPYGQPSYGAPPPSYGSASAPTRPGELMDRFLARLIDHILLSIVGFVIGTLLVVGALMGESVGATGTGSNWAATAAIALVSTAISLGYFAFLESSRGQTVGKMIMKLRTVGPDGGNPTMEQAIRRNSYVVIGLLALVPILGLVSWLVSLVAMIMIAVGINKDKVNRQAWHDHFAGETRVLKIG